MKLGRILLVLISLYAMVASAAPVNPSVARLVAENFWSVNAGKNTAVSLEDVSSQCGFQELYIFTHPMGKGFVIVAADDCVQPIIAYSLSNSFVFPLPAHVQAQLQGYEEEIAYYKSAGMRATGEISELWQSMLNGSYTPRNTTSVAPMLTTTWNQSPYYNDLCPDSAGIHAVTGCTATATAQVMKYWNWPVTGTGSFTYTDDNFGTLTANFGATTYNWSMMPNALNSQSTTAQVNAVATLMFHVGVAIETDYGINSSGAYTNSYGYSTLSCSENALKDYFGYKNTLYSVYKDQTTSANWVSILTAEMDAGRPVIEAGRGGGGHAFVCDGYDNNGLFHINWGWGSAYDGYFAHDALNPGGGGTGSSSMGTYNQDQSLVVGIEPNGVLRTNVSYLTLPQEGGSASFTVTSNNNSSASWTASSNQSWLTVSPSSGAGSGAVTTVNAIASANNTGSMRTAVITITQGNQSVTVTVSQSECSTSDMCTVSIEMSDSYGDGWNGSFLTLSSTSGYVYGTATFGDGSSATQQFNVCPSGLTLTWTSGSQWDDECSFVVNNAAGQPLLTISNPSGSYSVATPCTSTQPPTSCEVTTFPWNESFENGIDCWTLIDADGDGNNWFVATGASYDGTYSMGSYSYDNTNHLPMNALNYLISPEITLPATGTYQLIFYARCANDSYPDSILVKLSTSGNANASSFSTTLMPKTVVPDTYQQYTVNLSGHNGQSFYLAFIHDSYDGYYLLLDNISIVNASQSYTITATSANAAMGNVTGGGTYTSGAEVSLQATANAGYRFTGWDDGNTDNPRTFTAMANASYTAYFADLGTNELHYDNGAYNTGMGAGGTIYWAVRFPASVLTSHNTLYSVRIWDSYAGSYDVRICQGGTSAPGTQVASQTFTLSGTFGWYDATFSTPVTIDPTQALWVVLYNSGVDYPASASTYAGNADGSWVSLDGNNWNSICDYGYYLTWMIRPVFSAGSTPQTYTITAESANTSMGTVTGGGTYDAGTTIQLTATAYQGYEFVTWQDGNTSNPRTITVTENATYTAYFQAVSTNCTVTSFPWTESFEDGWNCWTTIDADGDGNYWGRTSNLPAHDGSYTLYSYSYDSNNDLAIDAENYLISPQITLPATGNYQLTFYARCASSSYPDSLWVKMSTTGNTNVSAFNTVLMTKTAIAASYQQYTVSLSGHNGQSFYLAFVHDSYDGYVVLLDDISIVDASVSYTITATSANTTMGTVSGGGTYTAGAVVELEAHANPGYRFTGWNDGNTENPRSFTVMSNASYTASFADLGSGELHYDNGTFSSAVGAGGTIYWAVRFPASVLSSYNTLTNVKIWDQNAGTYQIAVYQGGTDAPGTQIATQTFSLSGTEDWYNAVFSSPISINNTQALWIVLYNSGVSHPAAGSNYSGNVDGSWVSLDGSTWGFVGDYGLYYSWMVRPVLSAGSTPQTYTITALSSNNSMGTVTGGGSYTAGTTVQLIANPAANHHFVSWNDGNTSNPRVITVTGNATYIATFAVDQYQIDVLSSNDAMGTASGSGTYDYGSVVQIRANPYAGYEFINWNDGNTENPRDITVTENATYVANFQPEVGINDNDLSAISVYSHDHQIVVYHAEGERIEIYDMLGKRIAYDAENTQETRQFTISTKGVYLVRVGDSFFKKVVVK